MRQIQGLTIAVIFLVSAFFLFTDTSKAQGVALYGSAAEFCGGEDGSGPGTLYLIDPDTAEARTLGPIGYEGISALEVLADGRLVGSARGDEELISSILIEINPGSGQGSLIGEIGDESTPGQCGRTPGLTIDPLTNTLFGTGDACASDSLQMINQTTGEGTVIGPLGTGGGGGGLARRSDGTLFAIKSDDLLTVNPNTGQATLVGTVDGDYRYAALDFHPETDELYAVAKDEDDTFLFIIDPETGNMTEVGRLPDCADGIVFRILPPRPIPTLSQWGLIAMAGVLGLVGLLVARKRRNAVV